MRDKELKDKLRHYLSLNFQMLIKEDEEEEVYFVEFPDLPGCMAHGKTPTSAVNLAQKMKKSWIETMLSLGREIPEPKEEADYSGRITFRTSPTEHKRLAEQAQREERSLNQHIQVLVSEKSRTLDLDKSINRLESVAREVASAQQSPQVIVQCLGGTCEGGESTVSPDFAKVPSLTTTLINYVESSKRKSN